MTRRTTTTVHIGNHIAKFSDHMHAMRFAQWISGQDGGRLVEVSERSGLVGQYQAGEPTPEFRMHHNVAFGLAPDATTDVTTDAHDSVLCVGDKVRRYSYGRDVVPARVRKTHEIRTVEAIGIANSEHLAGLVRVSGVLGWQNSKQFEKVRS